MGDKRIYYKWTEEDLRRALLALERKDMSLNKICETYGIPKPTIIRHFKKQNKFANNINIKKGGPTTFDTNFEQTLVEHILQLENHMFGLTITDVRRLAFDVAESNKIAHRFNKERKMAGKTWFYSFKKRHPELSVRQPERTSLNRIRGFNRDNVNGFFDLLERIIDENNITPTKIFNVDESGFSTVQKKPQKVVGLKGKKQIGAITSGERGVNTTAVCCASVAGQFVPPMIIFKRIRQNPELANGAPIGIIVTVSESGYINSQLFVEWIKHFINTVKPTPDNKVLLLLDGHTTHSKNLEALTLAKTNGVIMLQLPGHTTHRLQPLDVSFFKPMSSYYIQATENWLRSNPGRQVTQYQVASLFTEAYQKAAVIGNVTNGFKASGIWPLNRNIFPEHLFEAAENMNATSLSLSNSSDESISILQNSCFSTTDHDGERNSLRTSNCHEIKQNVDGEKENKNDNSENILVQPSSSKPTVCVPSTSPGTSKNLFHNVSPEASVSPKVITPTISRKDINTFEDVDTTVIKKSLKCLRPIPKNTIKRKNAVQKAVVITNNNKKRIVQSKKCVKKTSIKYTRKMRRLSITSSSNDTEEEVIEFADDDDTDNDDSDNICALCNGNYYDKTGPKVDCIQCIRCKKWVHETCTSNPDICDNCFN
ncbi:unnamed protein product [Euphydryas editha]|uniref:HTH CENPB-type domain-containing protein n=1 Tax=Euphydryas editha TaxID=104508 RepID=A0AAU9UJ20_EUPED|nr:unnamed protein product [Euphydryas editha]